MALTEYASAQGLDPFLLDEEFRHLPEMNLARDVHGVGGLLVHMNHVQEQDYVRNADPSLAIAKMRDLDFVVGSLAAHGVDYREVDQRTEGFLDRLGHLMMTVPRGTVYTYGTANPIGDRQRSFTGGPEEDAFIDVVTESVDALDKGSDRIPELADLPLESPEFGELIDTMQQGVDVTRHGILRVMQIIPPAYFTNVMRPYFDPVTIGNKAYAGAGGAQMQFILLDRVLWGADCTDMDYTFYFNDSIRYVPDFQRKNLAKFLIATEETSLVTLIQRQAAEAPISPRATENVGKVIDLMVGMKKMRNPHRTYAQKNFQVRAENAQGSGGYTPYILTVLLDQTNEAINRLRQVKSGGNWILKYKFGSHDKV